MDKISSNGSVLQIEWICMQVFTQLLKRHLRYLLVIIPMYSRSIYGPARCHILRAAYCFARYLDDVLDGDIPVNVPQQEYVCRILTDMKQKPLTIAEPSVILGKYVFEHVDQYGNNTTLPSQELNILIKAMLFDRERANLKLILSRKELDQHHLETFISALHVTLDVTGASYQIKDIEPLARAQGSLYTLRDLRKDLSESINNIPQNVLMQTQLPSDQFWNWVELSKTESFHNWIKDEFNRGILQVTKLRRVLESNTDFRFKSTVKPLYKGLNFLIRKMRKDYDYL
ncbi:MAG TPA: squalene/phytoene synthase family protein [Balneolales bacterium]|nr:squalene/phytoene synthase family protein [Balneolales bacterium]